MWTN